MYAIYQSGGLLLGVGESIDAAIEDARWEETLMVNALGEPLDVDRYADYTRITTPGLEITGELYLRRCSLALFEAARDAVPSNVTYHVDDQGIAQKGARDGGQTRQ